MTRVGLLGGMSWQSTASYYRLLNESVQERVGGHASAPVTIHSVDFGDFEPRQRAGDWPGQARILADAAAALERAGVAAVALATNTLHMVADDIVAAITVPFVDLIDLVAAELAETSTVGLLATGYTMTSDLYPRRLAAVGTEVIVPATDDRALVHRIIYDELVYGVIRAESRTAYREVIARLVQRGAQSVIMGCTEIGLLIDDADSDVAVLDTTRLHCRALTDIMVDGLPAAAVSADRVRSATGATS